QSIHASTMIARYGTITPPGIRNGVPACRTSRRRSWIVATQQTRYNVSTDTFANTASATNPLLTASMPRIVLCTMMATNGVRYVSCTRASSPPTIGTNPSRPSAYRARGVASVMPLTLPNMETTAATAITPAPNGPAIRAAAADRGAVVAAASAPTPSARWATTWTAMYNSITVIMASASARGTVRAGSRTSPLGTSALSEPAYAKIRMTTVRPRSPVATAVSGATVARAASAPAMTNRSSGSSLITASSSTRRVPSRTPRTFTAVITTSTATMSSARGTGWASGCQRTAADPASALNTADAANTATTHSSTPLRNPANGPSASVTYAYGPPVSDTRLPDSAKQMSTRLIASAQMRYAMGARAPNAPAATAGSTKMPPPIMMLNVVAARPLTPMARTRVCSPAGWGVVMGAVNVRLASSFRTSPSRSLPATGRVRGTRGPRRVACVGDKRGAHARRESPASRRGRREAYPSRGYVP